MKPILTQIPEGAVMPRGYGIVTYSQAYDGYDIAPIPLHWIVRGWRKFTWWDSRMIISGKMDAAMRRSYESGWNSGLREGKRLRRSELERFSRTLMDGMRPGAEPGWITDSINRFAKELDT